MKTVKNKSKTFCSCSLISGLHGEGKGGYKLTNEDFAIMWTFRESLEKYCFLNSQEDCARAPNDGRRHTKIAVRAVSRCKTCENSKWEVLLHPPFDESSSHRSSASHPGHLLPFDPPELYTPDADNIREETRQMQMAGDGDEY